MLSGYSIPLNFVFASDSYDILGNSHSSCCNRNHTGIDADGASYLPGRYLKGGRKIPGIIGSQYNTYGSQTYREKLR